MGDLFRYLLGDADFLVVADSVSGGCCGGCWAIYCGCLGDLWRVAMACHRWRAAFVICGGLDPGESLTIAHGVVLIDDCCGCRCLASL